MPPTCPLAPVISLQVHRAPQGALARLELQASLERWDLQAHQGLLAPRDPQPLLVHPMPGSPSMVSPLGFHQAEVGLVEGNTRHHGVCYRLSGAFCRPYLPLVDHTLPAGAVILCAQVRDTESREGMSHAMMRQLECRGIGSNPDAQNHLALDPPQALEVTGIQPSECQEAGGPTAGSQLHDPKATALALYLERLRPRALTCISTLLPLEAQSDFHVLPGVRVTLRFHPLHCTFGAWVDIHSFSHPTVHLPFQVLACSSSLQ
jgi:hypothetical protein